MLRFLFFALIPVGAFVLILAIRLVKKSFAGKILLEIPYLQKSGDFEVTESGVYAIWQKGQYFRKLPVDQFRPVIRKTGETDPVHLIPSLFRPNSNDGVTFKMKMFSFRADPGTYHLELAEGSSISAPEKFLSRLFPAKKADPAQYYIQIRESQPFYTVIAGILLMVLAGFLMIGGLVLGILNPVK